MLDNFLDKLKKLLKSRLFPILLIYIALFSVIIHRLFVLQIVQGPTIAAENDFKETETREIKPTRGKFYDRKGILLASNTLSYSVTMEDNAAIKSNEQRNAVVFNLINIIKANGDTLYNDFPIIQTSNGELEFTISGAALSRFKKNCYAFVIKDEKIITQEEISNASAKEVYEFLKNGTGNNYTPMFEISNDYTVSETLDIMSIRYALFSNFPKFLQITVASSVSDVTVANVLESSAELPGVDIQKQTRRVYHDSIYFAHILGYTGLINAQEMVDLNIEAEHYNPTDIIGKTGLEQEYEQYLSGNKGNETVTVNVGGKVIDVVDHIDPEAGNDIYLTIDSELQKSTYHILEKKIAGILLSKIQPDLNYGTKGESASKILTPIYEVYFALINNNIIDINHLTTPDAKNREKQVYDKYLKNLEDVFNQLDSLLLNENTVTNPKAGDMENYLDYFYEVLVNQEIILEDNIPEEDEVHQSYIKGKTPLSSFLQHAIANNYIDLSKLNTGDEYYNFDEQYQKLISNTKKILENDSSFSKMIYRNMVFSYNLSGKEICLLLFDQGVLEYNAEDIKNLESGDISSYDFMKAKITSLEITPAMLALEPFSGSVVITDVKTGDVLAMVTYPSYDNNKLANKVDSAYYNWLFTDLSDPWMNRPTSQSFAPGSTFKMVTAFAGLEEGAITPEEEIRDLGIFEFFDRPAKCHIYPGSHGSVNITDAIKVSCNYFFYVVGFRLSTDSTGKYNEELGIEKLSKYAALFGLDTKSGVEVGELQPKVSTGDAVRSAIGQGSNSYTPIQLSRYVTTLANRGTSYDLTLLDRIVDKDGKVLLNNSAAIHKDLTNISASTWDSVQNGMYDVVNSPRGSVYEDGLYR
ncbi:MAG TPA: penicillin-binding transpeptidase domain-containing protein, partial [Mobilitalea sp.]|nr:penicillin-binding transpeptidase domain-containing protein [Mobilitalea sp.]